MLWCNLKIKSDAIVETAYRFHWVFATWAAPGLLPGRQYVVVILNSIEFVTNISQESLRKIF